MRPSAKRSVAGHTVRSASLAAAVLFAAGCGERPADQPGEPPRAWFESPRDGEVVQGPHVMVQLGASGVVITPATVQDPGTGHHHIFVTRDVTPLDEEIPAGVTGILHLGQGQTEFEIRDLEPGEHRLIAVVADWQHVALPGAGIDTIFITVTPPGSD